MPYYLSYTETTTGNDPASTITVPTWSVAPSNIWSAVISFEVTSLSTTLNVIGSASTVNNRLIVNTNGSISWSTVGITSAAGVVTIGTRYWVRFSGDSTSHKLEYSTNGTTFTTVNTVSAVQTITWNRLGQASSTRTRFLNFYSLEFNGPDGTYQDSWTSTTAPSTGTAWASTSTTRNITLTSFTGPANSWWVLYGVVLSKPLKYHNGTTWVTKPLKYHNGTTWVEKPLKYHNGTSWT